MNRRAALRAAAAFGLPWQRILAATTPALPDAALFERDPESYWKRIRDEQFYLPAGRSFLNNGSLGVAPRPVLAAVADYHEKGAALETADPYPRWGYETMDAHREELARFVGCHKDEIALMHNATEANTTVASGLDLQAGDEVVMTDQEHPSGRAGWAQKAARYGATVRQVKLPLPPKSPEQLADVLVSAIGPRTKVLSFSGMTSPTGLILPIRQICDAARSKNVITMIDGAHMHGQMPLRISDLNCDFFSGSPHKWMFAPPGCGFLYIRDEWLERLWPLNVTGSWDDKSLKAGRFMRMGTNNRALFEGMLAGMRFANAIGTERIYERIHTLARHTFDRARKLPYIELLTPDDDRMFAALVAIRFKKDASPVWQETAQRRIFVTNGQQVRLSSHIHTRPSDIDALFDIIEGKPGRA